MLTCYGRETASRICRSTWRCCASSAHLDAPPAQTLSGFEAVAAQAKASFGETNDGNTVIFEDERIHEFHRHKVARFDVHGGVTIMQRTAKELNLALRDSALFNEYSSKGKFRQRANISVREGKLLIRTELVRAIVTRNSAVLFECKRPAHSQRVGLALRHRILMPMRIPFECRVLEALLESSAVYLESKAGQIRMLSNVVQDDISRKVNSADIRRLLPLQKAVTALEYDIREMSEAISEVANNRDQLAHACLSDDQNLLNNHGWTTSMHIMHRLLLAYEQRIRTIDSELRELTEHLDSTREVWHMQLDAMRNRIIRINLHLSFASVSTMAAVAPAALFGMNLTSGLEEDPNLFYLVVGASVASGGMIFSSLVAYYQLWPMRNTKRRVNDMTALHDLLMYHVDEIGDVVSEMRSEYRQKDRISRAEFEKVVNKVLGSGKSRSMSGAEIDLLHRVLDTNQDGWIYASELYQAHNSVALESKSLRHDTDDTK